MSAAPSNPVPPGRLNKEQTKEVLLAFPAAAKVSVALLPVLAILHAATDPHSPPKYRINGVVVNMPEFARVFNCKTDAPMVKPDEAVCRLW